jgi:hypothetical protein
VVSTLIISAARETATLHNQKTSVDMQSQQVTEALVKSSKQVEAIQNLQSDLQKLSVSDPIAAKIVADYFPGTTPSSQNPANQ